MGIQCILHVAVKVETCRFSSFACILIFISIANIAMSQRSKQLCPENSSLHGDCSNQIPQALDGSCHVIPTNDCRTFDFSTWIQGTPANVKNEEDTPFSVIMEESPKMVGDVLTNALNVTLKTDNEDITGFVLLLNQLQTEYNSCRIFDFRKARGRYSKQITLFYDCYFKLDEKGILNYLVTVRALPQNIELQYLIKIVPIHTDDSNGNCKWQAFIMINMGSLLSSRVDMKFQPAPDSLNITHYNVSLVNSGTIKNSQIISHNKGNKRMIFVSFKDVIPGDYIIKLTPLLNSNTTECLSTESPTFEISIVSDKTFIIVGGISSAGLLVIITLLLIFYILLKPPSAITKKPKVLIIYSYDCRKHKTVVSKFALFLEKQCYVDAIVDIHDVGNKDADFWLIEKFKEVDVVIVVISQGVFHKWEKSNYPPMKEGLIWGDIFCPAKTLLVKAGLREKKNIVKVYFNYSSVNHIPQHLHLQGETYHLMNDINILLCNLHDQKSRMKCLKIYPRMPGEDFLATPEGLILNDAIEDMIQFQKEHPDWFSDAIKSN